MRATQNPARCASVPLCGSWLPCAGEGAEGGEGGEGAACGVGGAGERTVKTIAGSATVGFCKN